MFTEEEALKLVEKAIETATKFFSEDKYFQAEVILGQALKVCPENIQAMQLYGLTKSRQGKQEEATNVFKKAIELCPDNIESHNNIALCYGHQGKFDLSVEHLQKAIGIKPDCAYLHANLGLQYRHSGRSELALPCFHEAIRIKPEPQTYCMLGGVYGEAQQIESAEECFKKAIDLDPQFAPAHCDLATIHQLRGNWGDGWKEYEWRFEAYEQVKYWLKLYDHSKRWYGEPVDGKRVLLHNEQGTGDSIHFFRYVTLLREQGAYVIIHCQEDLASLYRPHVDEVYTTEPGKIPLFQYRPKDFPMPEYDYFASLLSLPYLLGNPTIPKTPYLSTESRINMEAYSDYFKIGIVWAGNPQHPNDAHRSCHLSRFRPIHDLPGVKLFSLQKDNRLRQYRFANKPTDLASGCEDMKIVDMTDSMKTFEDTAAILHSLDLLVSVDTSVVHLAGAIGTPCWALIPYNTDWRWKLRGETTDWYSSVRLFRQHRMNDWTGAFDDLVNALKKEKLCLRKTW